MKYIIGKLLHKLCYYQPDKNRKIFYPYNKFLSHLYWNYYRWLNRKLKANHQDQNIGENKNCDGIGDWWIRDVQCEVFKCRKCKELFWIEGY